jgi:hypothetical protein
VKKESHTPTVRRVRFNILIDPAVHAWGVEHARRERIAGGFSGYVEELILSDRGRTTSRTGAASDVLESASGSLRSRQRSSN